MNNLTTSNIDPKHAGHTPVPEAIGSPLFSIVLPTHNRPALLEEAVASVCQQDLPGWELLIIDDASNPPVEARNFSASAGRIRVCRNAEAQGGAASKALGTQLATGQFVAYLDDDDLFAPEFLSTAASVFSELPDLDVLFVGVEWFGKNADKEGRPHSESLDWVIANTETRPFKTDALLLGENLFDSLLQKVPMPFQRPVVRQSSLKQIGLHTPHCLLWDCDWALRAALHARCALTTKPLYRQRASQQGYYSRSGTSVAQATSELEIARRLY